MNKNVWTRVMAALGGIALWVLGLCALAETFFRVPVTAALGQLMGAGKPLAVLAALLLAIALCVLGTCCLLMLNQKRAVKRSGFVMQNGENGVIGVSVKSIEGLVQTCVKQHAMVASAEVSVVERKDGIVILLNIREAAGVNIPLAVGALQKQIKQYVTDCTGVDVCEVRVLVDNTDDEAPDSPYAVRGPGLLGGAYAIAAAEPVPELPVYEKHEETAPEDAAAESHPAAAPVMPVGPAVPPMPVIPEDDDDRPLHQRLFGTEEQPAIVPAPPEMMEPVSEESKLEAAEAEAEPPADAPTEEDNGNAVLEVVEAIAREEESNGQDAEEGVPAEDEEKVCE